MEIIYFMLAISLLLSLGFLVGFIWASKKGQFDDLDSPAWRMVYENKKQDSKKEGVGDGREI